MAVVCTHYLARPPKWVLVNINYFCQCFPTKEGLNANKQNKKEYHVDIVEYLDRGWGRAELFKCRRLSVQRRSKI